MKPNPMAMGLFATLALACCATGKVIYVDDDAVGANDGTSWADAYVYLQDALADANDSERPVEIRVAQGVYTPDPERPPRPDNPRNCMFLLAGGVTLRGGYAGSAATAPWSRDVNRYRTVLSGDLLGNDVGTTEPSALMADATRLDNSYHVISICPGPGGPAVLDGLTITAGNGEDHGVFPCFSPVRFGGGLLSNADGQDGYPDVMVRDCSFEANSAGQSGGAIYHCAAADLTVINCRFTGNYAGYGGAIEIDGTAGGGATLASCVFADNRAAYGGAVYGEDTGRLVLSHCAFCANRARRGAALYVEGSGGGRPHVLETAGCLFAGNWADRHPWTLWDPGPVGEPPGIGAIATEDAQAARGGALYVHGPIEGHVAQCTFASNVAPDGHTVFCDSEAAPSSLELRNCIIWGEGNQIWNADGSTIAIAYTDVCCPQGSVHDPYGGLLWGPGNVDADPCFARLGHWDHPGDIWVDGDYHLKSQAGRWDPTTESWVQDDVTSPCIDAGDPNSPVAFEPFPDGGIVNMGAYGGTAEASKSPSGLRSRYGGGTGEADDPYLIYTAEQINAIGAHPEDWDKHFKLMADINLAAQAAAEFDIIGRFDDGESFNGTFDGSGHTISNFTYASPNTNGVGLFGYVGRDSAEIRDLTLVDPNVDAGTGDYAGALVGYLGRGSVVRCRVEGASVRGDEAVGGLVGYNWAGVIVECSAAGAAAGRGDIGGLVGGNQSGTIADCRATGTVTGESDVGGLVGDTWGGTILTCRSSGSVSGRIDVGGLVGDNAAAIADCYSTASVTAAPYSEGVGGLVGENALGQGMIENCYAAGRVTAGAGSTYVGGLVGDNGGAVRSAFWDIHISGQTTSDAGTGKTTAEMQTAGTFLDAGWDFIDETENGTDDIWWMLEGHDYPRLFWEPADEAP